MATEIASAATPFILRSAKRYRRAAIWLVGMAAAGLLAVSQSAWPEDGLTDYLMGTCGLVLLVACAFGRIWSSIFIAGYKNDRLITDGPYSIVRNPLYVFSFLGAIGLGLAAESFIITAILVLPFLVWFPVMVSEEERVLAQRHGQAWTAYAASTPRFIPAWRSPTQPASYAINTRQVGRAFLDAVWFPIAALGLEAVEALHYVGVLPTWYHLR